MYDALNYFLLLMGVTHASLWGSLAPTYGGHSHLLMGRHPLLLIGVSHTLWGVIHPSLWGSLTPPSGGHSSLWGFIHTSLWKGIHSSLWGSLTPAYGESTTPPYGGHPLILMGRYPLILMGSHPHLLMVVTHTSIQGVTHSSLLRVTHSSWWGGHSLLHIAGSLTHPYEESRNSGRQFHISWTIHPKLFYLYAFEFSRWENNHDLKK